MSTAAITNFETLKNTMQWGTYGKGGVEHCGGQCPEHKLAWVKLVDRETEHLQAILRTQRHIYNGAGTYVEIIHSILADRGVEPEAFSYEAEQEMYNRVAEGVKKFWATQPKVGSSNA